MILIHNRGFDRPRLVRSYSMAMPIEATEDTMDLWHLLLNAYKRTLGFVSSLNPLNHRLRMWKHLNRSHPELYSCLDALALLRNHKYLQQQLDVQGVRPVWELLHIRLDPVLDHMGRTGMLCDRTKRDELSAQLAQDLEALIQQMNAIVPEAVRSPKVWVTEANAIKGRATLAANAERDGDPAAARLAVAPIFTVPAKRDTLQCSACGELDVKKDHVTRKFLRSGAAAEESPE